MLVTPNCFQIPHQTRTVQPFRLWIDAICIDQSSSSGRNHQVSLMTDIYQKAAGVWFWLGELDQDCEDLIRDLSLPGNKACLSSLESEPERLSEPQGQDLSLCGELTMVDPKFPAPDYNKNVIDIYADVVEWVFTSFHGGLYIIYSSFSVRELRGTSQLGLDAERLPSWVPDFAILPVVDRSWSTRKDSRAPKSDTGYKILSGRRLRVSGCLLGTVASYHPAHTPQEGGILRETIPEPGHGHGRLVR